jgi:predicted dehydrogenase
MSDIKMASDIELDGVTHTRDYRRLFDLDLDGLVVCLPNNLAPVATQEALNRGVHVFCEKPPGRTVEDVIAVMEAERASGGCVLKYGFNHRYHKSIQETKAIIDSQVYGKVRNLRGVYGKSSIIPFSGGWRSERAVAGGGILLDQGIHMLDMMRYFAGDFVEIKSFVSNDYWHHDVEDNAFGLLRTADGCVAMIHSTATQWRHKFRLEITLDDALIELTGILSGSKSYGEERMTVVLREADSVNGAFSETATRYLNDSSWQDEIDEFARAVTSGVPIESGSSADALAVMKLVFEIYRADDSWAEATRG